MARLSRLSLLFHLQIELQMEWQAKRQEIARLMLDSFLNLQWIGEDEYDFSH